MWSQCIVVGNVGREPELSYTPQGIAVCKFSVAENRYQGKDKEAKTIWYRVTVWRNRAETASQYIKKGMKVMVVGEVEASAYINKNGRATASLELTATDFKFLDGRGEGGAGGGQTGEYAGARGGNQSSSEEYEDVNDIPF
jgi:single-strand DNA-binding protein